MPLWTTRDIQLLSNNWPKNSAPKKQISSFLMRCCVLQLIHRMLGTKVGHSWKDFHVWNWKSIRWNCTKQIVQDVAFRMIHPKTYSIQHVSFHYFWTKYVSISLHAYWHKPYMHQSGVSISAPKVAHLLPFPVFQLSSKNNQPCQTFLFAEYLPASRGKSTGHNWSGGYRS